MGNHQGEIRPIREGLRRQLCYNPDMAGLPQEVSLLNGRYRLMQRLGSGGMASVYKAEDLLLGRLVAVKILHEGLTDDSTFLESFQREAHAAANLSHPNIVTVHDIGQDGTRYYIVMEYVEGRTPKDIVREQAQMGRLMPVNRALDLTIQVCAGIGYAHRAGLVHCDVKPHNVLVSRDDRVKVTDFGIARAMSEASAHREGLAWGTPQYFSPEQAAGQAPTPASDVYSIGVMLFELLTGRLPFEAKTPAGYASKHLHAAAPLVSELNPAVPPHLEEVVHKVLGKDPVTRYRTAGQFGRILSTYRRRSQDDTLALADSPELADSLTTPYHRPELTHPVAQSQPVIQPAVDWLLVILGIVALIALLGLIPLWYNVYQAWVS